MNIHLRNVAIFLLFAASNHFLIATPTHTKTGKVTQEGKTAGHKDLTAEQVNAVNQGKILAITTKNSYTNGNNLTIPASRVILDKTNTTQDSSQFTSGVNLSIPPKSPVKISPVNGITEVKNPVQTSHESTITEVKNLQGLISERITKETGGKTTTQLINIDKNKAETITATIITNDPKYVGITRTTQNDKKGKPRTTTIENKNTNTKSVIDHQAGTVSTSSLNSRGKVTFRADGSYSIEGKTTVVNFTIDAQGNPKMTSYSKGDLTSRTQPDRVTTTDKGRTFLTKLTSSKREVNTDSSTGVTTINNFVNEKITSRVKIQPDGTIISQFVVDTNGSKNFTTITETTTGENGTIVVTQKQADSAYDVVRTLQPDGSLYKKQDMGNGKVIESWENGRDITTTTAVDGSKFSSIANRDGSTTKVSQTGFVLTLKNQGSKGMLRTAERTRVIDLSSYTKSLAKANPKDYANVIDQITLKLTGKDNLFTGKVADSSLLQSPKYIAFKESIVKELNKNKPQDSAGWVTWIGDFVKRLASRLIVTVQSSGLKDTVSQVTEKINETNQNALSNTIASELKNENYSIHQTSKKPTVFTIKDPQTGTSSRFNNSSEAVINTTTSGAKAAFQPDAGYLITSANNKIQLTMDPLTGSISRTRIFNTADSLATSSAKQITTVDPKTGNAITITMGKDGITPVTMSIRGLDGSVKLYKADSRGNLPDINANPNLEPVSSMTVNSDGSIIVATNRITMLGKKQTATITIKADGEVITQGFGKIKQTVVDATTMVGTYVINPLQAQTAQPFTTTDPWAWQKDLLKTSEKQKQRPLDDPFNFLNT